MDIIRLASKIACLLLAISIFVFFYAIYRLASIKIDDSNYATPETKLSKIVEVLYLVEAALYVGAFAILTFGVIQREHSIVLAFMWDLLGIVIITFLIIIGFICKQGFTARLLTEMGIIFLCAVTLLIFFYFIYKRLKIQYEDIYVDLE